jgi:hypothetical protein
MAIAIASSQANLKESSALAELTPNVVLWKFTATAILTAIVS